MANFGTEVLGLVRTVAPTVATGLGGPLAGLAVRALCDAFGLPKDTPPDTVSQAVLAATPDQLLALKQADNNFKIQLQQLDVDLAKVGASDVANARARQVGLRDQTPALLAGFLTLGFFVLLGAMVFHALPPDNQGPVNILLGALGGGWVAAMNYFFGSSVGSRSKDELLFQSMPASTSQHGGQANGNG